MPAKSEEFWRERLPLSNPCHYGEPWQDWYAWKTRRAAIERIWPHLKTGATVLDVGCGDGRLGEWVGQRFGVTVVGLDKYMYEGALSRLSRVLIGDAETEIGKYGHEFDLAMAVTSLPFMANWRNVVDEMTAVAKLVLVVDNTQQPTPAWQQGLAYKAPFTFDELRGAFDDNDFVLNDARTVNVVDREWIRRSPAWLRPLTAVVTYGIDRVLADFISPLPPSPARYTACLFEALDDE